MVDIAMQRDTTKGSFVFESKDLRFSSPLFAELAKSCAEDQDICALGSVVRPGQPIAILILEVAQYLLYRSPESKLGAYFPSMTDTPKPSHEAFPAFREFCLDRREEMLHLLSTRTVNTNLVERASTILPVSQYVAGLTKEPLTLVEICCSAGLNLLFDLYHHDYGAAGQVGNKDASIRLACKVIGKSRLPIDGIPDVANRVGIDLVTVDCSDPDERLWMEAVLFPEWHLERSRLRKALALQATRKTRTVKGDAIAVLPSVLEEFPEPIMVYHTFCMGQWFAAAQGKLDEILRQASRYRDIHRIGVEVPDVESPGAVRARLAALSAAGISIKQKSLAGRIEHTSYSKGRAGEMRLLGHSDGLGSWIDWQA